MVPIGKLMSQDSRTPGGRRPRPVLLLLCGGALTVAASLLPGALATRTAVSTLNRSTLDVSQAISDDFDAQVRELEALSERWVDIDPARGPEPVYENPPTAQAKYLFSGFAVFTPFFRDPSVDTPVDVGVVSLVRTKTGYDITNYYVDTEIVKKISALKMPIPAPKTAKPQLIRIDLDERTKVNIFPNTTPTDSPVVQASTTWAIAVPSVGNGWFVAPVNQSGLAKLLEKRSDGASLDVALYTGSNGKGQLLNHRLVDFDTSSLRRASESFSAVDSPLSIVVWADSSFGAQQPISGLMVLLAGLSLTALLSGLAASRGHKRETEALETERDTANSLARTDVLTGLPNRLSITELLEGLSESALETSTAVLLCDLDRFKIINDARGHDAGDMLLAEVARRLQAVEPGTFVGRLGGDEFVMVLTSTTAADAVDVGHRVVDRLKEPFAIGTDRVVIGSSVGLTFVGAGSVVDRSSLLRDADLAMYAAKHEGGNRVSVITEELRTASGGQLDIELDLRRAFGTTQLEAWYQPLVNHRDEIVGLEALVRWQHPTKGLLSPAVFLPAAKRAGLLGEVSTIVLSQVCVDVSEWNRQRVLAGQPPVIVHVNCVEEQLMDVSFADVVAAYLASSGMDPAHLLLEISEETAMDRLPKGLPTMKALRSLGVRFSLDDFGFGNASLTMVRQLGGVAEIKLDKSIVDGLAEVDGPNEADLSVIQAVKKFASDQGITLVAEGIELASQRDLLVGIGVDVLQGYLFYRPQPRAITEQLLLISDGVSLVS